MWLIIIKILIAAASEAIKDFSQTSSVPVTSAHAPQIAKQLMTNLPAALTASQVAIVEKHPSLVTSAAHIAIAQHLEPSISADHTTGG